MAHRHKGTVRVDIGELEVLVQQLKQLKDTLSAQKQHIPSLQSGLYQAIGGTAVNITTFDQRFDQWMQLLNTVIGDMELVYFSLKNVLDEVREHEIKDVLEALKKAGAGSVE